MVFRAHAVKSNIGRRRNKNRRKNFEVVDRAIAEVISVSFGGSHTPRTCMLRKVAAVLHKTHKKWDVNKKMKGWEMEGRLVLLPFVGGGDTEVFDE